MASCNCLSSSVRVALVLRITEDVVNLRLHLLLGGSLWLWTCLWSWRWTHKLRCWCCPGSGFDVGVSRANVVAGDDAMDDARLGMIIGKSAMPYRGATDGPCGTTYCSTEGGALGVEGTLLRTALGLVEGTFNGGRLFGGAGPGDGFGSGLAAPDKPDPVDPPVICVSSSSAITMGCSASEIGGSEEAAGPVVGRGRSNGEALKILPACLSGPERHSVSGAFLVRHKPQAVLRPQQGPLELSSSTSLSDQDRGWRPSSPGNSTAHSALRASDLWQRRSGSCCRLKAQPQHQK